MMVGAKLCPFSLCMISYQWRVRLPMIFCLFLKILSVTNERVEGLKWYGNFLKLICMYVI